MIPFFKMSFIILPCPEIPKKPNRNALGNFTKLKFVKKKEKK